MKQWGDFLTHTNGLTRSYELRQGKRLGTKWELKLTPMHLKQIERLGQCNLAKDPRSAAAAPAIANRPDLPVGVQVDAGFNLGDVVRHTTIRSWSYTVLGIKDDGHLEVERIGVNPPIRSTLSPASIELIRRGGVIEVAAQKLADNLEQQARDAIAAIEPATTTIATVRRGADASQRVMQMVLPTIDDEF